MRVERVTLDTWAEVLPTSGFEVFHTPPALQVLGDHADGTLELFVGYKGQQPVAMLPLVVRESVLSTMVFSPPPAMNVPRLGPVMMPTSPKRRKQERVNQRFTSAVLEALDTDSPLEVVRLVCNTGYTDPRPFKWHDFDVSTKFTYHVDLTERTESDLLDSFSSSLRREINDGESLDLTIDTEGTAAADAVFEQTRSRYEEQDRGFPIDRDYVTDLVETLAGEDRARVYTARDETGELLTGITVLYSNDLAYYWQGGTRTEYDGVSVNSLLHWRIMADLLADPPRESITGYDLMGANTERLCRYKSKFGADLIPYFEIESGGPTLALAKRTYRALVR